jgi:hypothetical protein
VLHRRAGIGGCRIGLECGCGFDELVVAEGLQLGAQLHIRGHQGGFDGDHRGRAGLDRAAACDLDQPDRLDLSVSGPRDGHVDAGQDLARRVLGIDDVTLT